jgi:hypothetical protein
MTFQGISWRMWLAHIVVACLFSAAAAGMSGYLWTFPLGLFSYFVLSTFFEWLGPRWLNGRVAYQAWRVRREQRR